MDANTNPIELCGTVAAVIYQNEENGYTVLKLDVDDGSQTMVVGCIPYAVPGESMIVTGSWMTHPAHGQQFKADFAERTMPETADAIYAYLAGRAVRGIGPATASLMVSRFGADTLNVLEYEPEKLCTIKGISLSKAKAMSANFRRQAGMRRLIEFLASANIRPVIALRMYQYYGDDALQLVQDNPYILVSDAIGATFQEADALALGHGFDDQSAERVAAATLYELAYNAVRGHCFISYRNLLAATSQLSGVPDGLVAESVDTLVQSGELVRERVAGCDGCYLARLHEAEAYIFGMNSAGKAPVTVKAYERKRQSGNVLDVVPEGTPAEVVEHRLPENERICSACGSEMVEIGKEVRRSLMMEPAEFWVREDVYYTYACKNCEQETGEANIVKAAKKAFDELGVKRLPSVKSLQEEYAKLLSEKKAAYAEYRRSRDEMRELLLHKQNVDRMLGKNERSEEKKQEHDRQ